MTTCNGAVIVWTGRVEYDVRVVIVIRIDIIRCLLMVYVVDSASVFIIFIIIIVVIILSRDVVLIGLVIVWLGVGEFKSHSIKDFQSDRGLPHKPPDQFENTSG